MDMDVMLGLQYLLSVRLENAATYRSSGTLSPCSSQ